VDEERRRSHPCGEAWDVTRADVSCQGVRETHEEGDESRHTHDPHVGESLEVEAVGVDSRVGVRHPVRCETEERLVAPSEGVGPDPQERVALEQCDGGSP